MSKVCLQVLQNLKNKYQDQSPFLSFLKIVRLTERLNQKTRLFTLSVPSRFHKERAKNKLLPLIKKELAQLLDTHYGVQIEISPFQVKTAYKTAPLPSLSKAEKKRGFFNPSYTFDSFISGPSNKWAFHSLKQAGQNPLSCPYSPIFIYGKTGLGKTHLLHALGQNISKNHPYFNIQYLSAERFLHKCVTSIRLNQMDAFQKQFRQDCQVLLIDDIQGIERGLASQEEFFHTFNAISERKGLVVCTCDRLPAEIKKLETRLQTRLSGGLVIQIEAPDLETRMAILQSKAHQKQISLSQDVISCIAQKNLQSSIRELEGLLNKVKMICMLQGQKPSLDIVQEMLSSHSLLPPTSIEGTIQQVADQHHITPAKLVSSSRNKDVVYVRNQAIYLVRKKFPHLSLNELGRFFGGRKHSTILNALRQAKLAEKKKQK